MNFIFKKLKFIKDNYFIEAIIITILGIILLHSLFINPILGKFNNGDFDRLMVYGGISETGKNYGEIYDGFMHVKYQIGNPKIFLPVYWDWVSGAVLVKLAVVFSVITTGFSTTEFDIRYLGFIYSAIFLIASFFILSYKRFSKVTKILAGAFIILFFTSTCYIAYFNSFYGEAATVVFFLLNIGTYLYLITKKEPKIRHFVYFFIASGGFLTAKSQNLPLLIFMLIMYGGLYLCYKEREYRKSILIGTAAVFAVCFISYFSLTDTIKQNNLFQSVFSGVLIESKNPEKDLEELGLNKKLAVYAGHSFYNKDNGLDPLGKEMMEEFYPKISNWKILGFYLRHPDIMWDRIEDAAEYTYDISKPGTWSYEKNKFDSNRKVNNFRLDFLEKFKNVHHNVYLYLVFSVVYSGISLAYLIKSKQSDIKLLNLMMIFILAAGSSQFILPMIGAGHGDFGKHLFLLNFSYDIMLGITLVWGTHIILKLFSTFKLKTSKFSRKSCTPMED
jgi:hypothetical protein